MRFLLILLASSYALLADAQIQLAVNSDILVTTTQDTLYGQVNVDLESGVVYYMSGKKIRDFSKDHIVYAEMEMEDEELPKVYRRFYNQKTNKSILLEKIVDGEISLWSLNKHYSYNRLDHGVEIPWGKEVVEKTHYLLVNQQLNKVKNLKKFVTQMCGAEEAELLVGDLKHYRLEDQAEIVARLNQFIEHADVSLSAAK